MHAGCLRLSKAPSGPWGNILQPRSFWSLHMFTSTIMHDSSNHKAGRLKSQAMNTTGSSESQRSRKQHQRAPPPKQQSSWFSLPSPIRQIFDTFPLVIYDDNKLPQRVPKARNQHTLHVFTVDHIDGAREFSPNPACLKWQAFLLINNIPFQVVSANNHASPTGALPFLLPAQKLKEPQPQPIPASKILRWAETEGIKEEPLGIELEAYMSLIDQNIRNAWLYFLYLDDKNFGAVARKLYVETASSNRLVQAVLASQLQAAAKEQLSRSRTYIDQDEIYGSASSAFQSLATKLADFKFFSKTDAPNLLDVTLFSYTHLILSLAAKERFVEPTWRSETLCDNILQYQSLVDHRNNVLHACSENRSK